MKHYIPLDIESIGEVWFEVDAKYGNFGIGKYEFWGAYYVDDDYRWEVNYVDWEKQLFTDEENLIISTFVENTDFEKELEKQNQ